MTNLTFTKKLLPQVKLSPFSPDSSEHHQPQVFVLSMWLQHFTSTAFPTQRASALQQPLTRSEPWWQPCSHFQLLIPSQPGNPCSFSPLEHKEEVIPFLGGMVALPQPEGAMPWDADSHGCRGSPSGVTLGLFVSSRLDLQLPAH